MFRGPGVLRSLYLPTEPHETIELRARAVGRELVLEVVDGGHGVPPEAVDRIFERFARADDARNRAAGGAGLGLAIVDAIARAHGGSVAAEQREPGSLFELRLPLQQARMGESTEPAGSGAEDSGLGAFALEVEA